MTCHQHSLRLSPKERSETIVDDSGDTLVIMNLEDAKVILNDLLEYEIADSIINCL